MEGGRHRPLTWTRLDAPWLAGPRRGRDPRHCRSLPCMPSFPSPGAVQYMAPGGIVSIVWSTVPCRLSQRRRRKLREGMRASWSGAHARRLCVIHKETIRHFHYTRRMWQILIMICISSTGRCADAAK
jgi:hypothetical protein